MRIKTGKTDTIFNFIVSFKLEHDGNSPTTREIGSACGITSTSLVNYYLDQLEKAGRIVVEPKMSRMINVIGGKWRLNNEPINLT